MMARLRFRLHYHCALLCSFYGIERERGGTAGAALWTAIAGLIERVRYPAVDNALG